MITFIDKQHRFFARALEESSLLTKSMGEEYTAWHTFRNIQSKVGELQAHAQKEPAEAAEHASTASISQSDAAISRSQSMSSICRTIGNNSAITVLEKVKATHDFSGDNDDELSFKKGNVIVVMKKIDAGWWVGSLDGKMGMFPANYVASLDPASHSASKSDRSLRPEDDADVEAPKSLLKGNSPTTGSLDNSSSGDLLADSTRKNTDSAQSPGFSYLPRLQPGMDLSSIKRTTAKIPPLKEAPLAREMSIIGPCGECNCNEFSPNVFKPKSCNNCFHFH